MAFFGITLCLLPLYPFTFLSTKMNPINSYSFHNVSRFLYLLDSFHSQSHCNPTIATNNHILCTYSEAVKRSRCFHQHAVLGKSRTWTSYIVSSAWMPPSRWWKLRLQFVDKLLTLTQILLFFRICIRWLNYMWRYSWLKAWFTQLKRILVGLPQSGIRGWWFLVSRWERGLAGSSRGGAAIRHALIHTLLFISNLKFKSTIINIPLFLRDKSLDLLFKLIDLLIYYLLSCRLFQNLRYF